MIGSLVLISIGYVLLVPGSSERSWYEFSISWGRRSAGNSPSGGSKGDVDTGSLGESIGVVLVDPCFTITVAPTATRTIAAVQPTTIPAITLCLSLDGDVEIGELD